MVNTLLHLLLRQVGQVAPVCKRQTGAKLSRDCGLACRALLFVTGWLIPDTAFGEVSVSLAGGDAANYLVLNVQTDTSAEGRVAHSDFFPFGDAAFPLDIERDFSVEVMESGTATGRVSGTATTGGDGSLSEVSLSIGVTGQDVDGPGIMSYANGPFMHGELRLLIEVTDKPVDIAIEGSAGIVNHGFHSVARLTPNGFWGEIVLVEQSTPATFEPVEEPIDRETTLIPGTYELKFQVNAYVKNPDSPGDSSIELTITFSENLPELDPIAGQSVSVGETLEFPFTITGSENPFWNVYLFLDPETTLPGMSIDYDTDWATYSDTGVFSWTPTAEQAGTTSVTMMVLINYQDNKAPPWVSDTQTFDITVTGGEPAEVAHWINTAGGGFDTEDNWDPVGVPGTEHVVYFDAPGSYSVNVGNQAVNRAIVGGEPSVNVTFENSGLTAASTSLAHPGLVVNEGTFTLASGILNNTHAVIGASAQSEATIGNAIWENQGRLTVGGGGEAVLWIQDSGFVSSAEARVGDSSNGSTGEVTITGEGSEWLTGNLAVGYAGPGTMTVMNGAKVVADAVYLGWDPGAAGLLTVGTASGEPAANFEASGDILVARDSDSTLVVRQGGFVSTEQRLILGGGSAEGFLEIESTDDSLNPGGLTADGGIVIGGQSPGTATVLHGGTLVALGLGVPSVIGGDEPGRLTVGGSRNGSRSNILALDLVVGQSSLGELIVENGGKAGVGGWLSIGGSEEEPGSVTLEGSSGDYPSELKVTENLYVGGALGQSGGTVTPDETDYAGTLIVRNGGEVSTESSLLVGVSDSGYLELSGNEAAPGNLISAEGVTVGLDAIGTVAIADGGLLLAGGHSVIGDGAPATVLVTGAGDDRRSELFVIGGLEVGRTPGAEGSLLQARLGGKVTVATELTVYEGATVNTASGNIYVGEPGDDNSPNIGIVSVNTHGTLGGNGTVVGSVHNNGGTVTLGASPGILTIEGDYVQGPEGALEVEVGGTEGGAQYDRIVVNGDVQLDGDLNLVFIDAFSPEQGQVYEIINTTGSTTGAFSQVNVVNLEPGFEYAVENGEDGVYRMTALTDGHALRTRPAEIQPLQAVDLQPARVRFIFSGPTDADYVVEGRNSLAGGDAWETLGLQVASEDGLHSFTVDRSTEQPSRFFRLRRLADDPF